MKKVGVFVLGYPVLEFSDGALFFGDECYRQTIDCCARSLDQVVVVARRRKTLKIHAGCSRLADVNATLGLELPDFGKGGMAGWREAARFIVSVAVMEKFQELCRSAVFIYVDCASFDAYLAARAARRSGKGIMLELRGDVLMNLRYMTSRYGGGGIVYSWLARAAFAFARRQAFAGLYINQSLQGRYPVRGDYSAAISDARILPEFRRGPKIFLSPAENYIYVGHLEKVKKVDLIIRALKAAEGALPAAWSLMIIGRGPEEMRLRGLSRRLGIESRVVFKGRVDWGESLFELYRQAHLLIVASLTESGPRVMVEAMASGLPVLSARVGIAAEVLDAKMIVGGWKVTAWAKAILAIVNNPSELSKVSSANVLRSQAFDVGVLESERRAFYAEAMRLAGQK